MKSKQAENKYILNFEVIKYPELIHSDWGHGHLVKMGRPYNYNDVVLYDPSIEFYVIDLRTESSGLCDLFVFPAKQEIEDWSSEDSIIFKDSRIFKIDAALQARLTDSADAFLARVLSDYYFGER